MQFRRSIAELMQQLTELFESYRSSSAEDIVDDADAQLTAPLSALPSLIDAFERRRKIELLTADEKDKVRDFAQSGPPDLSISIDDFVSLLQNIGVASTSLVPPASPSPIKASSSLSLFTPSKASDKYNRTKHSAAPAFRSASAQDFSRLTKLSDPATPSKLGKRRSLLSLLAQSPKSSNATPLNVSDLLIARGESYLGVALDGPLGPDFDAEQLADKLRSAIRGVSRVRP